MSDLKQEFDEAVNFVQSGQGDFKPDNNMKLEFYALFKQATEGDVKGKKPGITDFVGRRLGKAERHVCREGHANLHRETGGVSLSRTTFCADLDGQCRMKS